MNPGRRDQRGMGLLRGLGAGLLLLAVGSGPALAQFLPPGFFTELPEPGAQAEVEANTLGYDARSDVISAEGRVVMRYGGYTVTCDNLRYQQKAGSVVCEGNARATDPQGTQYQAERIDVTGGMKEAFLRSLTVTTSAGAVITAKDASFTKELETTLLDATYSPCGDCIDAKGHRIGWRVKAAKLVQSDKSELIYFEQPSLEILGMPVAWLPWLWLPDPSKRQSTGFQLPTIDYKDELGLRVRVPYIVALGKDTDILLAPQLMTRQGFLMAAEWQQRFDYGAFTVKASGINQLDPEAFAGTVGNREWRGAIQTSGEFRVAADWVAGWSYTNFSDAAYMEDYDFSDADRFTNEVYATHLSDDFYADVRLQQFLLTGDDVPQELQDRQPTVIPNARGEGYFQLGENGQVRTAGTLLGVQRAHDHIAPAFVYGGVPYVFGYEEQKVHATGEVSWQNQYVGPGGIVATPFLGLRADVTSFDAGVHIPGEPDDQLLLAATPIAAVDVRWPLMALNGADSHLLEPIAQLVYRGSDVTEVGVTNDNAHSFVLDDTNIFSYDRFSGTDRQETGLRANVGARYLANFDDGSWLELVAGQSFHLAGLNAMGVADEVNTGVSTGLGEDASYVVLGARGSPMSGLTLGADVQVDPEGPEVARAQFGGVVTPYDGYSLGAGFIYLPADAATGVLSNQEEIRLSAAAPLPFDYWRVNGSLSWDLAANEWLAARGEVQYDDGYFLLGGFAAATGPTNSNPNSLAFGWSFRLKGPGTDVGWSSY